MTRQYSKKMKIKYQGRYIKINTHKKKLVLSYQHEVKETTFCPDDNSAPENPAHDKSD